MPPQTNPAADTRAPVPTSPKYQPPRRADRLWAGLCWALFLALVLAALSGCTPAPSVRCAPDRSACISGLIEPQDGRKQ